MLILHIWIFFLKKVTELHHHFHFCEGHTATVNFHFLLLKSCDKGTFKS